VYPRGTLKLAISDDKDILNASTLFSIHRKCITYKTKGKENRRESYLKLLTKHFKKTHEEYRGGVI
uniref:hypothetical protein n=1 Tax=Parabacteroides distasonis TaxID=823 RepID=UPI003FEDFDF8